VFGVFFNGWPKNHSNFVCLFELLNGDVDSREDVVVLVHVFFDVDETNDIIDLKASDLVFIRVKRLMFNHTVIF